MAETDIFEVSLIVVNFNRVNLLRECLDSVAKLRGPVPELIVVDNGSTDGSAEMVQQQFPTAQLIRNRENRGFCAANNQGIALARGRWVALLNNDAVVEPGWLEALLATGNASPDIGMVASKILVYERPEMLDKAGHLIYWDGQNRGRGSGQPDTGQFDRERETLWPDGCAALYRRAMLEEIGGFDESFFAYADDAELGLRGRLLGWEAHYAPQAVVRHHRGATLGKLNPRRIELIERNRIWLVWKHFPWWLIALNPFFFALRLAASTFATLKGKGEAGQAKGIRAKIELASALLRANWQALAGLASVYRKRREWRKRRLLTDRQLVALLRRFQISLRELTENAA